MRRVLWVMEKPTYEQMLHFIKITTRDVNFANLPDQRFTGKNHR